MASLAPIVLFVYRRPYHTLQTLSHLAANPQSAHSELFIFADGPSDQATAAEIQAIREVRKIIAQKKWCGQVHIQAFEQHQGIFHNITQGISEIVHQYGKVIVLEDDLISSPGFLTYMNDALTFYESEEKVMQVNAYMYPIRLKLPETFFYNVISSWGWGTWKRAWDYFNPDVHELYAQLQEKKLLETFDLQGSGMFMGILKECLEGRSQAWDIRWYASVCLQQGFCLCPSTSLIQNIGFDNSGTYSGESLVYHIPSLAKKIDVKYIPLLENNQVRKRMRTFYRYGGVGIPRKLLYYFNRLKGRLYTYLPSQIKSYYKTSKRKLREYLRIKYFL